MECQVGKLEHFWRILLLSSIEGRKQRRRPETFAPCMATMPSQRARQGNGFLVLRRIFFYISVTPRSRRPSMFDEYRLNTLIHNDPHQCSRELANMMNCDHSTIVRHLHSTGKVKKSGVWVPHALSQNHKNQRVAIWTESSKYYARQQTAVARGLAWPARRLTGRQTAAAPKHSLCSLVQFPINWSRASTYICKTETLGFTDCDYC